MSTTDKEKLVDLTAPYLNDSKLNAARLQKSSTDSVPIVSGMERKEGLVEVVQEHRKFGNGKDVSEELAHAAPKREKDLHPSNTYVGKGDEVAEDEWD